MYKYKIDITIEIDHLYKYKCVYEREKDIQRVCLASDNSIIMLTKIGLIPVCV